MLINYIIKLYYYNLKKKGLGGVFLLSITNKLSISNSIFPNNSASQSGLIYLSSQNLLILQNFSSIDSNSFGYGGFLVAN